MGKRRNHRHRLAYAASFSALLAGCASQGPLHPPSLRLPASVRGLAAARVGNNVDLDWTNPSRTTDSVSLTARHGAGALQAEICRAESFPAAPSVCAPVARIPAVSGEAGHFQDALPAALVQGPARILRYRVRVVNAAGKGAAWTEVLSVAGEPLPPVAGLHAAPAAQGILVQWQPGPAGVMLRVFRGSDTVHSTLLSTQPAAEAAPASGAVDTSGRAGEQQRYTAFRRRTVVLEGKPLVQDSASASITVSASARLPLPLPPGEVEALAVTLEHPEADLVWQPPADPSVTGYRVYREENGLVTLLTKEPLKGFTYADASVQAGHAYRYAVASVNSSGETRGTVVAVAIP